MSFPNISSTTVGQLASIKKKKTKKPKTTTTLEVIESLSLNKLYSLS